MPNFSNISNGESGLSVRNTLNQVIDYVNTGITQDDKYVTGGTYNNSTGTLTLQRQNGSVNITGFTTGFTETQNLTNVLALGNTTGSNNIVVNNGQSVQSVSGNTKMEFVSDTQLDITSTGNVYISGGTGVELEYYGSPTITSYLLLDNTNNKLHTDDGTNTNEFTQTPTSNQINVTDGTDTSYITTNTGSIGINSSDNTSVTDVTLVKDYININHYNTLSKDGLIVIDDDKVYLRDQNTIFNKTNYINIEQTEGNVINVDSFSGTPLIGYANTTQVFPMASTDGLGTGFTIDITFDVTGEVDSFIITQNGYGFMVGDTITTTDLGSGSVSMLVNQIGKSAIELQTELGNNISSWDMSPTSIGVGVTDGSTSFNNYQNLTGNLVTLSNGGNSSQVNQQLDGIVITIVDTNTDITNNFEVNNTQISSIVENTNTNEIGSQSLTPTSFISTIDNDGTSQIYTQVTQQESEFLVQVEDAISGGLSSFSIQTNYSSWNSDNVPTDERVGLEFDPSGGLGQTRFYKENYVTNESSGIFLNVNQVLTRYVSSAATINYLDINDLGIDSQSYGTPTQFQSTNGISSNTFTLAPTSTTTLSTDGTFTNTITIDPDRSLFEITDGTILTSLDFDATNGTNWSFSDGTSQINIGYDAYTGKIQNASTLSGITDELIISPDSNVDNTKLKSSFSGGAYSELVMTYDNPSFDCYDGITTSSSLGLTPSNPVFSSGDGTWISRLELDPTENSNQTILQTTDNTSKTHQVIVGQNSLTITSSDLTGFTSTEINLQPTSMSLNGIPSYDDDADAGSGGLITNMLYQTTGLGAAPLDVAGILMIKQ